MFWILSVVEMYLMLGFIYNLVVFPELMTWLYIEVYVIFRCDVLCLRYSMHV